ncbi:MAG: hypothetical protein HFH41_01480 [Lachnospiraceae bacterium]|nr:hypothetical protein [Lachnospiraceae bacterium]
MEKVEWKETESFDSAAESLESQTEEKEQYEPEDVVRVYIQAERKEELQEIVERISEEVLKGKKLEVHSLRTESGILTANVGYQEISRIREVEGVASVELAGKGEIRQEEEGKTDQPAQETRTEAVLEELEKPEENNSFLWFLGGIVFLLLAEAVWKGIRRQKKDSQEREDKQE